MSNRPEVLLLSLAHDDYFDNHYYRLINNLCIASSLNRVKTLNGAIRYLSSNTPKAILITDGGIADLENSAALEKVKSYVQAGGIAIFGMQFPRIEEPELAHYMFNEVLGLDWWFGDYCSVSVGFNPFVPCLWE